MLTAFRAFAQTWFAKALLVLLGLAMVVTLGVGGRMHGAISNAVITAGSHEVSPAVFKRIFQTNLEDAEKQAGQQVTNQEAVAHGFDLHILQGLEEDEASAEFASRLGVRAAPKLIIDVLRQQSAFFDPITGKFDPKQYATVLGRMQLTPDEFEGQVRDEIAQNQLLLGLNAGLKAPHFYAALVAGYELEDRSLSYVVLDPRTQPTPPAPTDAQLLAFMTENRAALTRPETRVLTVVRFSPKALEASMPVDQAAVQKAYEFKKDTLSTPEKRTLVEIPAKDAASAAAAAKRLGAGEAPDAIAKSLGVSPVTYTDVLKTGVADPKVAEAAFSMSAGKVSGPIKSDLGGFPVVKLIAITPATTPSLESLRPQLEQQARKDAAAKKVFDAVQKFDAAHQGGANLVAAAKQVGFDVVTVGPVSAQGGGANGQPIPGLSPKLLKDAFSQSVGAETDSVDDGQGEYYALRVEKITPPGMPALADIKEPLTKDYILQQQFKNLKAKADDMVARIKKGQTIDAVAASADVKVNHAQGVNQQGAEQYRGLGPQLVAAILQAKQGQVVEGVTAGGQIMVARIETVTPAAPGVAAGAMLTQRPRLSQQLFASVRQAEQQWATAKVKPTYDIKLARAAINVSDADAPPPTGAPAGKAR